MDSIAKKRIIKYAIEKSESIDDFLTTEKALAIHVSYEDSFESEQLSITMRTPGNDKSLAIGFLFNENVINNMDDIVKIVNLNENEMVFHIKGNKPIDNSLPDRNFVSSSSCGVCGKSSIEDAMKVNYQPLSDDVIKIEAKIINDLPNKLRIAQQDFEQTGGIHAVGLFDPNGNLISLSEDVGRHNALDKMIGEQVEIGNVPLKNHIVLLSGRVGYELVQKSLMAGVTILAAIGAPSSLSVEIAEKNNMTLIGFLKSNSFNLYTANQRIAKSK